MVVVVSPFTSVAKAVNVTVAFAIVVTDIIVSGLRSMTKEYGTDIHGDGKTRDMKVPVGIRFRDLSPSLQDGSKMFGLRDQTKAKAPARPRAVQQSKVCGTSMAGMIVTSDVRIIFLDPGHGLPQELCCLNPKNILKPPRTRDPKKKCKNLSPEPNPPNHSLSLPLQDLNRVPRSPLSPWIQQTVKLNSTPDKEAYSGLGFRV